MSETERHYDRRFPGNRRLRVADRDREAVADILRREHIVGRIDNEEFEERITRCLAAKTYADLDALIEDFPADERTAPRLGRRPAAVSFFPFFPVVPILVAAIILSDFVRCTTLGCDLRMQSGWVFMKELILPGVILGFFLIFLWHVWRSRNSA